jgi:hypothetical protein
MSPHSRNPACILLTCFVIAMSATEAAADECDPARQQFPTLDITAYEFRRGDANCPSAQRFYTNCLDADGTVVKSVRGRCASAVVNDGESTPLDEEN